MKFPMVGTITSNIRMAELNQKWEKRKEEFTKPEDAQKNSMIESLKEDMARIQKSNEVNAIYSKLQSGAELSEKDLDYLRTNSPQMYEKAVKVAKEREAYRKELERCETKEDVRTLNTNKLNSLLNEAKTIMGNANIPLGAKLGKMEEIQMRLSGIQNEHMKFISTPRYSALPDREDDKKDREDEDKASEKDPARELEKMLELLRESTYRLPEDLAANGEREVSAQEESADAKTAEVADTSTESAQQSPEIFSPPNAGTAARLAQTTYAAHAASALTSAPTSATPQPPSVSRARLSKKI